MTSETTEFRVIGILSDIHGNMHALQSVLEAFDEAGITRLYCCGDVVGYGPHPNECCAILREREIPTIVGNHDYAALGLTDTTYFNEVAKRAIDWTTEELSEENLEYLREMPLKRSVENALLVHACPSSPEEWAYILTMGDARQNFGSFEEQVCFVGHSHQPFIIENDNEELSCPANPRVRLRDNRRYLVNVGSVGQPRDRNPDACYAILNLEEATITIERAKYDIAATQHAIHERGLPVELGDRLAHGW